MSTHDTPAGAGAARISAADGGPAPVVATSVAAPAALARSRYGRASDESAARRLRRVGVVLGVLTALVVGWFGWSYITGQRVSGELVGYRVLSDDTVEVHLRVVKDAGAAGVCTLRSLSADRDEVGLKDVRITERVEQVDAVVRMETKARATNAELLGCQSAQ